MQDWPSTSSRPHRSQQDSAQLQEMSSNQHMTQPCMLCNATAGLICSQLGNAMRPVHESAAAHYVSNSGPCFVHVRARSYMVLACSHLLTPCCAAAGPCCMPPCAVHASAGSGRFLSSSAPVQEQSQEAQTGLSNDCLVQRMWCDPCYYATGWGGWSTHNKPKPLPVETLCTAKQQHAMLQHASDGAPVAAGNMGSL